ncbi:unnamed protein product [Oncorhynchus mykiss]|uniref:Uncharacterized protein n=1 Tax=Oncorhynchus mykiss TaxID=8022 RepID=A0A060WCX7_ONCMY|nr:unnamed protein product [Oncorhynchus mykiss]
MDTKEIIYYLSLSFALSFFLSVSLSHCLSISLSPGEEEQAWSSTPDSVQIRGRGENKAINDLDRDFWNNNDSSNVQQRWSSYPPKEFLLNMSPYAPYGDPRLTPK